MSNGPVLIFDDEVTGSKLSIEVNEGYHFFHSDIKKWSPSAFKRYLDIFCNAMVELNDLGIDDVYVCISNEDDKLRKWEEMFGFKGIREHEGHLLMHRGTV